VAALAARRGEQSSAFLAMLLPVLTHAERLEILRHLEAEPGMLERAMAAARQSLSDAQVARLNQGLADRP
jgi:hypothetical protein